MEIITKDEKLINNAALSISESVPCLGHVSLSTYVLQIIQEVGEGCGLKTCVHFADGVVVSGIGLQQQALDRF